MTKVRRKWFTNYICASTYLGTKVPMRKCTAQVGFEVKLQQNAWRINKQWI